MTVKIGTGIKGKKFGCPCGDVRLSGFKQGNIDIKKLAKRIAQIEGIKNGEIELLEVVFTIREAK